MSDLVRDLETVLRGASGVDMFATSGVVNYPAMALAVSQYLDVVLCADCRDDMADNPLMLSVGRHND